MMKSKNLVLYIALDENITKAIEEKEIKKNDLIVKYNKIKLEISEIEIEIDDLNGQRDSIFLDYKYK